MPGDVLSTPPAPRLPLPRGYLYAGLEFGAECYCGHKVQASNASESECNMECKGERSNICGGVNRLSIYRLELAQESARRCKLAASMRLPVQPLMVVVGVVPGIPVLRQPGHGSREVVWKRFRSVTGVVLLLQIVGIPL